MVTDSGASTPPDMTGGFVGCLNRAEDDELRRLDWIARIGVLSTGKRERVLELRLRDRRQGVRQPREFVEEQVDASSGRPRKWYRFLSR